MLAGQGASLAAPAMIRGGGSRARRGSAVAARCWGPPPQQRCRRGAPAPPPPRRSLRSRPPRVLRASLRSGRAVAGATPPAFLSAGAQKKSKDFNISGFPLYFPRPTPAKIKANPPRNIKKSFNFYAPARRLAVVIASLPVGCEAAKAKNK